MAKIRCNACGSELEVIQSNKSKSCGCSNHTLLRLDRNNLPVISAEDLSEVVSIEGFSKPKTKRVDNYDQAQYNKRTPRKLEFEIR